MSDYGFEALRFSVWGAWRMFGSDAHYVICVNTIPVERARTLTGELPPKIIWRDVTGEFPAFLKRYFDPAMAEGVGWKFAPLRLSPDDLELSLDNDCIIWETPKALGFWIKRRCDFLFAEDVRPCFGQFSSLCGDQPRNSGIRGIPPGFDFGEALMQVLRKNPVLLKSELDEQGLQTAALIPFSPAIVTTAEVSICSPFPPHLPDLGKCGAHFVGLNAKSLPWDLDGRPAVDHIRDHWRVHRSTVRGSVFRVR